MNNREPYMNMPWPNLGGGAYPPNNHFPPNSNQEIRNLENRIYQLEREMNRLKSKVARIENSLPVPTPYNEENYTSNYTPNGYNRM